MPVPRNGFFWGTARAAWYMEMVLEVNGVPNPSAHPFPFPPLVPFVAGRESGAQLPGEGVWDPLTQRGIKVGMAEPA